MTLAIIGSRDCPAVDIEEYLDEMPDAIVSGGAKGADTYAREFAEKKGIRLIEHLPDYAKYGKVAPLVRNRQIIDCCDEVLAFWDGKSKGTKYTIDYAKKMGKPVRIVQLIQIG